MKTYFLPTLLTIAFTCSMSFGSTLDTSKSTFTWRGSKVVGDDHTGMVKVKSSNITEDKTGKVTGGVFVMDMASLDVTDLKGKKKTKFLNHIKSADFFEVSKYPTAKLLIDQVNKGTASGKLTIKDKTNPVTMKFDHKDGAYVGKLTIDRTKFNVIYGSGNFFKKLGDKAINDEITISFKVILKKG